MGIWRGPFSRIWTGLGCGGGGWERAVWRVADWGEQGRVEVQAVAEMETGAASNLNSRVEPLQFDAGFFDSELPVDGPLLQLHQQGMSLREISRRLHISRNAVRRIVKQEGKSARRERSDKKQIDPQLLECLCRECDGRKYLRLGRLLAHWEETLQKARQGRYSSERLLKYVVEEKYRAKRENARLLRRQRANIPEMLEIETSPLTNSPSLIAGGSCRCTTASTI